MEETYPVFFGTEPVGKVQVFRQGLYYRFVCRCALSGQVVCRLYVTCEGRQERLGVVVPEGTGFGLDTKVAVKHIGQGTMSFALKPKREEAPTVFVPISPEEPFAYLARLKDAYLEKRDGTLGAMLPGEHQPSSRLTGQ